MLRHRQLACLLELPRNISRGHRRLVAILREGVAAIRGDVATRIKELRDEHGLTQERFALMIGLNRSYLADIEKGNRTFGIDTLDKIVRGFGISYAEFSGGGDQDASGVSSPDTPR